MPDDIKQPYYSKEEVNIEGHLEAKPKQYGVKKVQLSENIQNFDKKPRVYVENPFSYKSVSEDILEKKRSNEIPTPTAETLIAQPLYNRAAKFMGVDTVHDWNKYADKVYTIVEWAKKETGESDLSKIVEWIGQKVSTIPSMGQTKRVEELYLFAKLELNKDGT